MRRIGAKSFRNRRPAGPNRLGAALWNFNTEDDHNCVILFSNLEAINCFIFTTRLPRTSKEMMRGKAINKGFPCFVRGFSGILFSDAFFFLKIYFRYKKQLQVSSSPLAQVCYG